MRVSRSGGGPRRGGEGGGKGQSGRGGRGEVITDPRLLFSADGPLSKRKPGYKERPEQVDLAAAVEECFDSKSVLLCDAPTGTGKSLGYLAPAILRAAQRGEKVVVSTATLALQAQLLCEDLPPLRSATAELLGYPEEESISYVVMKGRRNSLCTKRHLETLMSGQIFDTELVANLDKWAAETKTGDREDLTFPMPLSAWTEVASDGHGRDAETDERLDPSEFDTYQRGEKKAYVLVNGEKQFFPRRRLSTVEYSIEASYNGLYDELRGYLGHGPGHAAGDDYYGNGYGSGGEDQLTYARYGAGDYVLPEKQGETRYRELRQAGGTLRGLMRVLLFKRFESSVEVFRATVRRLLTAHQAFLAAIEGGKLPSGKRAERILNSSDLGGDEEAEEDLLEALAESGGADAYDVEDFDVERLGPV